jgi:hypothetical protein
MSAAILSSSCTLTPFHALAVLNSHENQDMTETYTLPLKNRGSFHSISGKIGPHAYLMGKFEDGNKRLWLQANAEYPDRPTDLTLTCKSQPKVTSTPPSAAKLNNWDAALARQTKQLEILRAQLSPRHVVWGDVATGLMRERDIKPFGTGRRGKADLKGL